MRTTPRSARKMKELSRFGASYYAGLTIEADPDSSPPILAIDGHRIPIEKVRGEFVYSEGGHSTRKRTLAALSKRIIDISWARKKREKIRQAHLAELRKGLDSWNKWRRDHPEIRPFLFRAPLHGENLNKFNLCNANLIEADLRGARLIGTNFHEANLGGANLNRAKLMGANFCRTDLYETNLSKANLTRANLQGTQLARTNFSGATLSGCTIYGLSAWNLNVEYAIQEEDLRILYRVQQANGKWDKGEFPVQDLEVAQFVFLLLDNTRFNNFFKAMTSKAVVIMGRFQPKARKRIIDVLRRNLRKHGFLPVVFDFEPKGRDLTETIKTLVGLCQFAIVDITNPRSSPLELDATVKDYQVPFVPIIQEGEKPFSMFKDLQKYDWMLKTLTYGSAATLSRVTKPLIIDRALRACEKIQRFKARPETHGLSAEEYLASDREQKERLRVDLR
jgi:Pentapeptide repeats (8 copies)